MTLDSAIARFRDRQESLFRDACRIERADGEPTFDEDTGDYEQALTDVYEGDCLIRPSDNQGGDIEAGQTELRALGFMCKLPVDTPVLEGDFVTVTGSTWDAALVDRRFRVTDVLMDGWQICRRAVLEQITGFAAEEVGS